MGRPTNESRGIPVRRVCSWRVSEAERDLLQSTLDEYRGVVKVNVYDNSKEREPINVNVYRNGTTKPNGKIPVADTTLEAAALTEEEGRTVPQKVFGKQKRPVVSATGLFEEGENW